MKNLSIISLLFCLCAQLNSDIPPPPSPEEACKNQKEGDECQAFGERYFHGLCEQREKGLTCVKAGKEALSASAAPAHKEEGEKPAEAAEKAPAPTPAPAKADEVSQQGCNLSSSFSGMFSFATLLIGLFALTKVRKG